MTQISHKTLAKKDLDKGHVLNWDTALKFILAGRAIVTLEDVKDSARSTYLVEQAIDRVKDKQTGKTKEVRRERWFVHLLVGSDNTRNYRYLGCVDKKFGDLAFRTTKATQKNKSASAENINRFGDVVRDLVEGTDNSHVTRVWHRGICGHCGKQLTVPSSIATGLGPVCAKKLGVKMTSVAPSAIEKLGALAVAEMSEPAPKTIAPVPNTEPALLKHEVDALVVNVNAPINTPEMLNALAVPKALLNALAVPKALLVPESLTPANMSDADYLKTIDRLGAVLKKLRISTADLEAQDLQDLASVIDAVEKLADLAKPKRSLADLLGHQEVA